MKKELSCATIKIIEPGLVHIVYKDEYEVELKDVQEVDCAFLEFAKDSTLYVIMDTKGKYNIFSQEAQKYLSKETIMVEKDLLGGFAMIISNLPYRIILRFYMKVYKPNYKLQVFSNQENAKRWIEQIKEKEEVLVGP